MGWRADLANMCSVGLDQPATDQYAERSSQLADLSQMDAGRELALPTGTGRAEEIYAWQAP